MKAANGRPILASEGYKNKAGVKNGVASVQKNAKNGDLFDRKVAKNGKHHFSFKAKNGEIIGTSQMYKTAASMESGIKSVQNNAATSSVDDQT
ncbi:MAG: YegP family protein [Caulobacterales bacterium]|nr:YegP family protein [Caulobacterales bacterium]